MTTATQKHEPQLAWARPGSHLNPGSHWAHVPTCSCSWHGEPTFDKGEAARKAYAHARNPQATFRPLAECADEANEETIYDPARRLAGDAWRSDTPRPR